MPIRGEATARLSDGKTLTLAVNFATLARTAAAVELPADKVLGVIADRNDPRQMLAVLVFIEKALAKHHPAIGEDDIGQLMLDEADAHALTGALNEAVGGAFGDEAEGGDEPNPPAAKAGTSTSSKPSGRKRG